MTKVGEISPEVLTSMNSDGSKDAPSRTKTQELCIPREPVAPLQTSQSASSYRNTYLTLRIPIWLPNFKSRSIR